MAFPRQHADAKPSADIDNATVKVATVSTLSEPFARLLAATEPGLKGASWKGPFLGWLGTTTDIEDLKRLQRSRR